MNLRRVEECGVVEGKVPKRLAVCPNCKRTQLGPEAQMAHCVACGNVWPWRELTLVRGRAA